METGGSGRVKAGEAGFASWGNAAMGRAARTIIAI